MAKATKKYENVTYTLELTEEEARALLLIVEQVGGCSRTTPRGQIDSIQKALSDAGVPALSVALLDSKRSQVWFK